MRDTLSFILFVLFILFLVFFFEGEPDVWDGLRSRAIGQLK